MYMNSHLHVHMHVYVNVYMYVYVHVYLYIQVFIYKHHTWCAVAARVRLVEIKGLDGGRHTRGLDPRTECLYVVGE